MNIKRIMAFITGLAMTVSMTGCGGGKNTASTMHLIKTEGTVSVDDAQGKEVQLMENLGLFSGYALETRAASYGWINLDDTKLAKMDAQSQIDITKEDKLLELNVRSGSLFFNVTEPLADDETMNIRTSTMMVGIRGTCGWVALSEDGKSLSVYLLEGKVRCVADGKKKTVRAGEMAVMTEDGTITVEAFSAADIPAFVQEEIEEDDDLAQAIPEDEGIDVADGNEEDSLTAYKDVLAELEEQGGILYTEMVDFEADGNPELLVLYKRNNGRESEVLAVSIYRAGPDGIAQLYFGTPQLSDSGRFSLVGYGDRIVMGTYRVMGNTVRETYYGSIAEEDGIDPSWNADSDWVMLDWIQRSVSDYGTKYSGISYDPNRTSFGGLNGMSAEEYAVVQAKYNELKVLAYSPDGKTLIITPDPSEIEGVFDQAEDAPLTDGNRIVLSGTVKLCTVAEIVELQGSSYTNGENPNDRMWLILLDDENTSFTVRSGDGMNSYESTAWAIRTAATISQYNGSHITFSINPEDTYWPSDTSLPLGQPYTSDIHVLSEG